MQAKTYISTLINTIKKNEEENAYRVYVADTLWAISNGKCFEYRYSYILNPKPTETRTEDEIIEHLHNKLDEAKGNV